MLKGVKHDAKEADRHAPTSPETDPALWARELTTQRVSDLFRTLPGLNGHVIQVQNLVNRAAKVFGTPTGTSTVGKELFSYIANAVVRAAYDADFDFPKLEIKFTNDMAYLKISRQQGRVIIHSQP